MPRRPPPCRRGGLMMRLLMFAFLAITLSGCTRPGIDLWAEFDKASTSKPMAASPTDKERIQGIWTFAGLEREVAPVTQGRYYDQAREMKWAFQGDCFHNTAPNLKVDGTFSIDPSQRPATLY